MMFCSSSFLRCLLPNSEMTFSISLCTDLSINPVSLSFPMVDLGQFFTNFSVLFECSAEQVVTGRSQRIVISVHIFGNRCLLACARTAESVLGMLLEPATSTSAFYLTRQHCASVLMMPGYCRSSLYKLISDVSFSWASS